MGPSKKSQVTQKLLQYLDEFNPWHNIKHMGKNVRTDILSGLTVAVIALPLALAFGVQSGLGAEAGVWGAICGGIFVGLFGGCRTAVSGPTGPKVVQLAGLVAATMMASGQPNLAFVFSVVFLSGVICLLIAFCKVGKLIYYTPYSVIAGFMCGIGAIILLTQVPQMLGHKSPAEVADAFAEIPYALFNLEPQSAFIAGLTLASIYFWPKISPVKWIPGALVGLLVGTISANLLGFTSAEYIAAMKTGAPEVYVPTFANFSEMLGPALALAGLAIFDSLMTCVVADNVTNDRHNSDREIFGQGLANMACGLVGGICTATATVRTLANIKCGAQSGLSAIVHGAVLLTLMLGLAPLATFIPKACLAAILFKVGVDVLEYRVLKVVHRLPWADSLCFWAVLAVTVYFDLLWAMAVGVAIAFVRAVHVFGNLYEQKVVSAREIDRRWPGENQIPEEVASRVLTLRLEGPLFFGVADALYKAAAKLVDYDYLLIRMSRVPYTDMSGAYLIDDIIERAQHHGAKIMVAEINPEVQRVFGQLGIAQRIGEENFYDSYEVAMGSVGSEIARQRIVTLPGLLSASASQEDRGGPPIAMAN